MKNTINEYELQEMLVELLKNEFDELDIDVNTFEDVGMLTTDKGIVLNIGNREFQITIVRSE